jgi:hypothetical protein
MIETKKISIHKDTAERLAALGNFGDSYESIIRRILDSHNASLPVKSSEPILGVPKEPRLPNNSKSVLSVTKEPRLPSSPESALSVTKKPKLLSNQEPMLPMSQEPELPPITKEPELPVTQEPKLSVTKEPELPVTQEPKLSVTKEPELPSSPMPQFKLCRGCKKNKPLTEYYLDQNRPKALCKTCYKAKTNAARHRGRG